MFCARMWGMPYFVRRTVERRTLWLPFGFAFTAAGPEASAADAPPAAASASSRPSERRHDGAAHPDPPHVPLHGAESRCAALK